MYITNITDEIFAELLFSCNSLEFVKRISAILEVIPDPKFSDRCLRYDNKYFVSVKMAATETMYFLPSVGLIIPKEIGYLSQPDILARYSKIPPSLVEYKHGSIRLRMNYKAL